MPSSVSPGDRDELSHLRTLVSLERVLGSVVDQVLALSLELLDQLLLESRQRVPDRLFQRLIRSWATSGRLFLSLGKGCILTVHRSQGASWTLRPLHILNDRLAVGRAASWLTRSRRQLSSATRSVSRDS